MNCSYADPLTKKVYSFVSDSIWFDIQKIVIDNNIKKVSVYMDPLNSSNYIIDIKEIKDKKLKR